MRTISSASEQPLLLGPAPEMASADQAGLVVVGAEVGRARMRALRSRSAGCSASRYFAATIGATCSSVWNSITRSTFSRTSTSALRCAILAL